MSYLRSVFLVATLTVLHWGCAATPRVVFEGTSVLVPVKSWIILKQGETVGNLGNVAVA